MRTRRFIANSLVHLLLFVLAIIWLLPLVWLVLQSFAQQSSGSGAITYLFPQTYMNTNEKYLIQLGFTDWNSLFWSHFSGQTYVDLLSNRIYSGMATKVVDVVVSASGTISNVTQNISAITNVSYFNYGRWFLNTLVVAIVTSLISTSLVLLTSYAFSRLRFKGRKSIMKFILILGMFPGFLTLIVVYQVLKLLGLEASLIGLIFCYTGGAGMGYYVSKGFFDTISKSVDEAAMIDGANKFQIFYKITLPLSKPIVIYTILTSFMGPWGDYITSSYIMGTNKDSYTIAVGLNKMTDLITYPQYWIQFCAGSVLIAIPISLLFIFLQKYYVSGVTGGAVKG